MALLVEIAGQPRLLGVLTPLIVLAIGRKGVSASGLTYLGSYPGACPQFAGRKRGLGVFSLSSQLDQA